MLHVCIPVTSHCPHPPTPSATDSIHAQLSHPHAHRHSVHNHTQTSTLPLPHTHTHTRTHTMTTHTNLSPHCRANTHPHHIPPTHNPYCHCLRSTAEGTIRGVHADGPQREQRPLARRGAKVHEGHGMCTLACMRAGSLWGSPCRDLTTA